MYISKDSPCIPEDNLLVSEVVVILVFLDKKRTDLPIHIGYDME